MSAAKNDIKEAMSVIVICVEKDRARAIKVVAAANTVDEYGSAV